MLFIEPQMRDELATRDTSRTPGHNNTGLELETMVDILKFRAQSTPNRIAYIYLRDGENDEQIIDYAELDAKTRRVAGMLQKRDCRGKRVLLLYPQGLEFIEAFLGCLYAGAVAVLMYPPTSARMVKRMDRILLNSEVSYILTNTLGVKKLDRLLVGIGSNSSYRHSSDVSGMGSISLPYLVTDTLATEQPSTFQNELIKPNDLALLQYTSGSTGTPKGVMVTHANIIANEKAIQHIFGNSDKSCGVSWLPILHDMGLIGSTLQPLFVGCPLVFMSPLHFMQRPVRWLRAISKYRATSSGGPNFAFDYCVNKVQDKDKESLDLSSWTVAFNGSEPVRSDTMKRFYQAFFRCGLSADAQVGVYGMAESTLILTGTLRGKTPPIDEETGYVSSGRVAPLHEIKIVDPETSSELPDGHRGEIWAAGGSITQGYWGSPEATAETFHATLRGGNKLYLRTGDMGYLSNGHLFVSGRFKDLIIIRGRNYHAEDIEWSLQHIDGLRNSSVAAFMIDKDDQDSLTIVAGVSILTREDWSAVLTSISVRIYEDFQLPINRIILIKPKSLPMTTSGKIQRSLTRQMYLNGELQIILDQPMIASSYSEGRTCDQGNELAVENRATTQEEHEIAAIWSDILGLDQDKFGICDNFFSLGGESLQMLELANRLDVSVELLFRYPTIQSFLNRSDEYQFPDVQSDIWLPPATAQEQTPTNISLITGGNGLFGFHLLASLLARTDDRFICLIRGKNDEQVREKFRRTAEYFGLRDQIDMDRIMLLRGDFGEKRLGLDESEYAMLVETVQRIYHIGSHVNNWLPYEGIKEVNVEGTRRLLALARTGRKKQFHYVSTSTFSPDKEDKAVFLETDDICPTDINKYNGYDISKYVSEQLCSLARRDGYDCNVYRLVWVGGHQATGLSKINDGLNIMLRILLTLGVYPKGNYLHDIIPVDLMADAVASVQSKAFNTTFNVTSQSNESIDLLKIVAMLRGMGYQLIEVGREEFVRRMKSYPDKKWDKYCRSYRQLIIRLFDEEVKPESFYDSRNLRRHLDVDVRERLDRKFVDDWFPKAVLFLVRNGALPTPTGGHYQEDVARIAQWNDTSVDYPGNKCVHQVFEAQVAKTPFATAVVFNDSTWTYSELNSRANQFAGYLQEIGIKSGDFVGVSLNRSFDLYASILGVMKAGAAYVPLCPSYPSEILEHIIQDSSVKVVLSSAETNATAEAANCRSVCIDQPDAAQSLAKSTTTGLAFKPTVESDPQSLAYVIYTSGTTGKPKGVMIEHHSVVNHSFCMIERFDLTPSDNVLQFATMNFDSFVEEVFPPLSSGAAISIIRDKDRTDIDKLRSTITRSGVTFLKFPTAFWHRVADESFEGLGVRAVGIGGEEADVLKFRKWMEVNPTIPVINTYGPTETTVTATAAAFNKEHTQAERLPIGTPIHNTQVHILDEQMHPVPIGTVGDLYISGVGVGRGYLNRNESTRKAFLQGTAMDSSKPLYYTGDHARWTSKGEIEFFGRTDNQVKIRGFRIELGAIESMLNEHAKVACAAMVLKMIHGEKRMVAYVQSNDDLEPASLKDYIRQRLPVFMTPDAIVLMDEIPMAPSGKIDRGKLEGLEFSIESDSGYSPPETELQRRIAAIWSNLLGVDQIGIDDDFLNLGGHSLLAITLLQRLYQELEIKLSIEDLYENLSIRALASLVETPKTHERKLTSIIEFPQASGCVEFTKPVGQMFLVHGVGGNLASFYPLARKIKQILSRDHSCGVSLYGLQANAVTNRRLDSAKEMIDVYVSHIINIQECGPYLIAGWSYGVSVAFLIAQELVQRGEQIAGFVSIDAEAPKSHPDFIEFLNEFNIHSASDLYEDRHLVTALQRFGNKFGFAGTIGTGVKDKLHHFLGYPNASDTNERDNHNMVAVANMYNASGFDPKRLRVEKALLIKATESQFDDYERNWSKAIDSSQVIHQVVDGDHWSIMSEMVTAILIAKYFASVKL